MNNGYEGIPIQRGHLVERDLLDAVKFEKPPEQLRREGYMPYDRALFLVKQQQPALPTTPRKPFSRELRNKLLEFLGYKTVVQANKLGYYTAVGSALDYWHGTDAFFQFGHGKDERRISLGVTTRDKENQKQKPDVEIYVPPGGLDETDKKFKVSIQTVAEDIMKRFEGYPTSLYVDTTIL